MENETFLVTQVTNLTDVAGGHGGVPWHKILLGVVLSIVVFITVAGNSLVLIAVYREKKLQTVFNLYIVNLAVTDIGVAVTAMSFYTIDNILGYWPFGEFMCGLWIFCDYGMTFASVFTLIVISIDRFWSVYWSVHYRINHNKRKCGIAIVCVWAAMVVLWLPACVTDRMNNAFPDLCIWEPSLNPEYVIVIALVGHHGSCFILLYCYLQVFFFMRKRAKVGPVSKIATVASSAEPSNVETSAGNLAESTTNTQTLQVPKTEKSNKKKATDKEAMNEKRERKVFVTLSYILFGYVICWVPFHIVFDVSAFDPKLVPEVIFTITFWMTYLNSTLNPFLYNFSSPDFKKAFKDILIRK